jgi:dipeptidyl aminopeptidase/acylaminoacyl peptidase
MATLGPFVVAFLFASFSTAAMPDQVDAVDRMTENVPNVPADLLERLRRYQSVRGAAPHGWVSDGTGLFVTTTFGNTAQVHWVKTPGGERQQLTFYDESVTDVVGNPTRNGFVFGKDAGGSEMFQLYWFDLNSREVKLLTDGKSRNENPVWSHDGAKLAYSSTSRNGKDIDVWILDLDSGEAKIAISAGGTWYASDFSPDGAHLLARQYVSPTESHPVSFNIRTNQLMPLEAADRKNSFGELRFSHDNNGVYFTSDESGEFTELRYRDFSNNETISISGNIPWDVSAFDVSQDGSLVAFLTNEDGYSVLHMVDGATHKPVSSPDLPKGVMRDIKFSPDSKQVEFALNSATSSTDAYTVVLGTGQVTRWTESEVGGLDTTKFITPTLVHYPTFDKTYGKTRSIPAWYYCPSGTGPFAVVISLHGGPASQITPNFAPGWQFLLNELHVALIAPNVRGSSGYGKTYLTLDDGYKREDSVKDVGALLEWIAKEPKLDAKRVGVWGGSYGGYLVLAAMARYGNHLRAGAELAGVSNFITSLEHTAGYRQDMLRAEYGDERDPKMRAFLEQISPTTYAAKITKPLFVSAGANDPRVPLEESERIVEAVRRNGTDVWFLEQKNAGHGPGNKSDFDYFFAATMLFWQKYLLDQEPESKCVDHC